MNINVNAKIVKQHFCFSLNLNKLNEQIAIFVTELVNQRMAG